MHEKVIYVHLIAGFEEVEALTPVDVLRRAGHKVFTVSLMGNLQVTGSHGITVVADLLFDQVDYSGADMIILPGGPGTNALNQHKLLKKEITAFAQANKPIAAICAAPKVLGLLGLLAGRKATCFPGNEEHLSNAIVTQKAVEVDGPFITANGVGSAMAFSLAIVTFFDGADAAKSLADKMMVS